MKISILSIMMLISSSVAQASNAPIVAINNPDNQSIFIAGDIPISAIASEEDGTIFSVSFYSGSILLGKSRKSPYSFMWQDVPVGTYTLTAIATDANNISTTSSSIRISVTPAPPSVSFISPANNSTFTAGSNISVVVTASVSNGTISTISLYNGTALLTTSNLSSSSFNYIWDNVPAGTYTLKAIATDNHHHSTTIPLTVIVTPSSAPVIAITSPLKGSIFTSGSKITINASASDPNGLIREVFFYEGTDYIGSTTESPYSVTWTDIPPGNFPLTVEATDSNGLTLVSAPVNITINKAPYVATPLIAKKKKVTKM